MSRKNKHDSSLNPNFLNKKRAQESNILEKNENNFVKKNSIMDYDSISGLYRNIFGFDWSDPLFKDGQSVIENLNPEALLFMYNNLYFRQDLQNISLINKSFLLNSFFEPFEIKYPDITSIKRSSVISEKVNFIFEIMEIFDYFQKKNNFPKPIPKDEEFSKFQLFLKQKLAHLKNLNRLRVASLIEKVNDFQENQKNKENEFNLSLSRENYITTSPILKDNQLLNSSKKVLNNYCSSLHNFDLEIIKQKKKNEKIFESSEEITRTKNDENWNCFICNNGFLENNDIFYECEQCKISVHQICYGILTDNIDHWVCDVCKKMSLNDAQNLECVLCPVRGGAMKQINLPLECQYLKNLKKIRETQNLSQIPKSKYGTFNYYCVVPKNDGSEINKAWIHVSCALWHQEIHFGDFAKKMDIKFIDTIPYEKYMEKCCVCEKIGYGPTIKCNNNDCKFRCHPECARINGYRLEIESKNNVLNYNIYCFLHQPLKLPKVLETEYKYKEERIQNFANFLKKTYRNYEREYQKNISEFVHPTKLKINPKPSFV